MDTLAMIEETVGMEYFLTNETLASYQQENNKIDNQPNANIIVSIEKQPNANRIVELHS